MPEGDVGVRIVGEHEYIYLSGSKSLILMDSGFVEGYSLGASGYAPCVLYETSSVAAYSANFVPTDPVTEWRVGSPSLIGDKGQVSGILTINKDSIRGKIPYDMGPARSFYPNRAVDPFDKNKTVPNPKDETLAYKKAIAVFCPASIFTGKCRLYVQALYGRFLHTVSGFDMGDGPVLSLDDANPGAAPALLIQSYLKGKATDPSPADITLNTSTGVYLDKTTGKHWLFKIRNGGAVWVYPLIGSAAAESVRSKLITEGANVVPAVVASLTDEDREHLETSILSTCRPDGNNIMVASGGISGEAYSLGYGWHWNWDGTATDIVLNGSTTDLKMSSTHYRGTVVPTRDVNGVITGWTASKSVVEGPKTWALERLNWCLVEPLWSRRTLVKSTPKVAALHDCDAPFYVFYNRNELKVCRVKLVSTPGSPVTYEWSPPNFTSAASLEVADVTSFQTMGMLGGEAKRYESYSSYWNFEIKVGSTSVSGMTLGQAKYGTRYELMDKKMTGTTSGGFSDFRDYYLYGTNTFYFGYPDELGVYMSTNERGVYYSGFVMGITYAVEMSQYSEIYSSTATLIVPFNDAEAIFVQAYQSKTALNQFITRENWECYSSASGIWAELLYPVRQTGVLPYPSGPPDVAEKGNEYIKYSNHNHGTINGNGFVSSDFPGNRFTTTVPLDHKKLHCNAGAVDATFSGYGFHDNSSGFEEIAALYEVTSGTRTSLPSVHAVGRINPVGLNGHDAAKPIFVGWV